MELDHLNELRKWIMDGMTIPKCINHAQGVFGIDESDSIALIREAFSLGPSVVAKANATFDSQDIDHSERGMSTMVILYEIVRRKNKWLDDVEMPPDGWFSSLVASGLADVEAQALDVMGPEESWQTIPDSIRQQFLTTIKSCIVAYERAEIMSRLAERLQSKLDLLEQGCG